VGEAQRTKDSAGVGAAVEYNAKLEKVDGKESNQSSD